MSKHKLVRNNIGRSGFIKPFGFVGVIDNKPAFELTSDDYTPIAGDPIPVADVYKSRKEARKRYQKIAPVYIFEVDLKD